jgi:hypothetical protein
MSRSWSLDYYSGDGAFCCLTGNFISTINILALIPILLECIILVEFYHSQLIKMIERIYIHEAAKMAGYQVRQFKVVCEKNGLEILCDENSSKQYLLKQILLDFLNRKPLEYLEKRNKHAGEKISSVLTYVSEEKSAIRKTPISETEKRVLDLLKNL